MRRHWTTLLWGVGGIAGALLVCVLFNLAVRPREVLLPSEKAGVPDYEAISRRITLSSMEEDMQPLLDLGSRFTGSPGFYQAADLVEARLRELGYRIIAISPDRLEKVSESIDKHNMTYTLLSDSSMAAAKAFGIAFEVDKPMLEKLATYNIDIEDASGKEHHLLPVPSVFLVGKDGIIDFVYANPDYKTRLAPEVLLAAAKAAL
jgi:peroxiredoxin